MKHLSEEQLTDAYYGDISVDERRHIDQCSECRANFDHLRELLDGVRDYAVPERGPEYGGQVWTRLLPQLPAPKPRRVWLQWWVLTPAVATLVVVTFFAGMLSEQRRELGIPDKARERVLLMAMSEHLYRSQIVLAQLVNATPGTLDLTNEQDRARDLIAENHLLRQAALENGDRSDAALLDELERVLLQVANSRSQAGPDELQDLKREIENDGLLFKVRITSFDARKKGQRL